MTPADYEAWYQTPRGSWIGGMEYALLRSMLEPRSGERLLDVGCGTGYFTRRFAAGGELGVTGLDIDYARLQYAAAHRAGREDYVHASAVRMPFGSAVFDLAISVAALCFIADERQAVREILRVTRRRFAIGLLHRRSLLYLQKGRAGGTGAYRGARWHTKADILGLFAGLPVANLQIRTAVALPGGGTMAQTAEPLTCCWWPFASFIAVAGEVVAPLR